MRNISISDKVSENKITFRLEVSDSLKKYFLSKELTVEYDVNIEEVNEGIVVIPALSTVIPIAWATGADVTIKYADSDYLKSLDVVKSVFRKWFSQFSFSTKINVEKFITNKIHGDKCALLFSGGVDSLASYVRNKGKVTDLISIWGLDIPTYKVRLWNMVRGNLADFAKNENVNVHFIKTNAREIIDDKVLSRDYRVNGWWGRVGHGLITLGLCAPLTIKREIGQIIISSTHTKDFNEPWGSDPLIDNNISWAGVKILHDGYELSRQEKIKILRKHPRYLPYLRSCIIEYNCGHCIKCLKTIVGLVLEDIDPKICNFPVNAKTFSFIRELFMKRALELDSEWLFFWRDIQKNIPGKIDGKLYGSEGFFRWFKQFDLQNYKPRKHARAIKLCCLAKYRGVKWITYYALKELLTKCKACILR